MMAYYQYRITVNGVERIFDSYPIERWNKIFNLADRRGGIRASFDERLITSSIILKMVDNSRGDYLMVDDNTVVCPWYTLAEVDLP